jgi:hypothetical protein
MSSNAQRTVNSGKRIIAKERKGLHLGHQEIDIRMGNYQSNLINEVPGDQKHIFRSLIPKWI